MRPPFILNGKSFDLSHLQVIDGKATANLRGGTKDVSVQVHFSCHCWSRSPVENESIPNDRFIEDGSREKPRNRIFCEQRYELSKMLSQVIRNLLIKGGHVHKTFERNIVRIDLVAPLVAGRPAERYHVFMKLDKRQPEGQQRYIKIFVESAYSDSVMYEKKGFGKPYQFSEIIGDCWTGRFPSAATPLSNGHNKGRK